MPAAQRPCMFASLLGVMSLKPAIHASRCGWQTPAMNNVKPPPGWALLGHPSHSGPRREMPHLRAAAHACAHILHLLSYTMQPPPNHLVAQPHALPAGQPAMEAPAPPATTAAAAAQAPSSAAGPPEIRVLEVDAYASVQDLIHAAILSNKGAAALKEVRPSPTAGCTKFMLLLPLPCSV